MDILVTFEDGTTELRADTCPCFLPTVPLPERFPETEEELSDLGYETLDYAIGRVIVWRDGWQSCRAETPTERIARLTRERDEAIARAKMVEAAFSVVDVNKAVAAAATVVRLTEERDEARNQIVALRRRAVKEATALRGMFDGIRGCEAHARTAWDEIVDAIDTGAKWTR